MKKLIYSFLLILLAFLISIFFNIERANSIDISSKLKKLPIPEELRSFLFDRYNVYPSKAIHNLLITCYSQSNNLNACACFIDKARKQYTFKQIQEIKIKIDNGMATNQEIREIDTLIYQCKYVY